MPGYDDPKYQQGQATALQGLELGAPLGGGTSGGALPGSTYTTSSSVPGQQTGDAYGSSNLNQTGDSYGSAQQGRTTHGQEALPAGVAAGMGAGHHDQGLSSNKDLLTRGTDHQSGTHGLTSGSSHSGAGLTSGSHSNSGNQSSTSGRGPIGELKEELTEGHGLTSKSGFTSESSRGGQAIDSVTGQPHFSGSGSGTGSGSHLGAGAGAGLVGAGVGAGVIGHEHGSSNASGNGGHGLREQFGTNSSSGGPTGPTGELRKELEMHKEGEGLHDVHHVESEGPHGLVFDEASGKYLHRREIDHKGSTGVPLK